MIRSIVETSLKFRLLVVALGAALLVVGVTQLRGMSVDVLPEFSPPTVEVQTEALGLSAAEVEQLITVPLEQDLLNGVAFLDDLRSQSVPGLSRVLMVFEPGTDLFKARQVVAERLTQAHALPHVSKPPQMLQPLSSTNRALMVGVSSKKVSALELGVLARWTIVPRLMGVPGVANVSIWGHRDRQLQVQVDPRRLREHNVTLSQILETSGNALWVSPLTYIEASTPGTGGFIDTPNQRLSVQHLSPIKTAADLAQVRIADTGGKKLALGQVASVVESHQPLIGDAVLNDDRNLLLVVEKFPGVSTLAVTKRVDDAINAMRPGLSGLEFDTAVYRPATFIDKAIDNVTLAMIIAALLVLLVLAAFFFRWQTALVSAVTIPLSLVAGALMLHAFGETMNAMALAGLVAALILVIDEAVVGVDAMARQLRHRRAAGTDGSTAATILDAAIRTRGAAVYGTLIAALAVMPLFFLESVSGAFFPPIVVAYLAALAASLVVAMTVAPALMMLLLAGTSLRGGESPLVRWLQHRYEGALSRIVRRPRPAFLAAGALVIAAVATAPFLSQSVLPTFKETELLITWNGAPGTSLPEMNRITGRASRELRALEGVRNVGAHVGRAVTADQVVGVNAGEIWLSIDRNANYDATLASVKRVVAGYPGLSREVQTYSKDRVRDVLSATDEDLVVRIYGEDLSLLSSKASEVKRAMSGVEGLVDTRVELPTVEPTLEIEPNLAAARRYGIRPGDVRRAASTLLSGISVGSLFEEQKVFDVVVWGEPKLRHSLNSVRQLLIDTPDGQVRLGEVADVRIAPNPAVINRHASSRYVDVAANVQGRDVASAVPDVEEALRKVAFPLEFHPEVLTAETQPQSRLVALGIAGAIGIFLLLQAVFGSWRLATLSFVTLPIAVIGGLLAALADGGTLSFGSYVGLLAVFGLAARSSVLLINHYRQLEADEGEQFGPGLVLRGARERLAPIVTTAVAGALAVLPLVIAGPAAGLEIAHPMAVVILGGLVTTTLVNLFVLPAAYARFGFSPETSPALAAALQRRAQAWTRRRSPAQEVPVRSESS